MFPVIGRLLSAGLCDCVKDGFPFGRRVNNHCLAGQQLNAKTLISAVLDIYYHDSIVLLCHPETWAIRYFDLSTLLYIPTELTTLQMQVYSDC